MKLGLVKDKLKEAYEKGRQKGQKAQLDLIDAKLLAESGEKLKARIKPLTDAAYEKGRELGMLQGYKQGKEKGRASEKEKWLTHERVKELQAQARADGIDDTIKIVDTFRFGYLCAEPYHDKVAEERNKLIDEIKEAIAAAKTTERRKSP